MSKLVRMAVIGLACLGAAVSVAQAGRVGGPDIVVERVLALDTDVYTAPFRGGELAEIVVDGDGDTDLDLYVFDECGNLVACDNEHRLLRRPIPPALDGPVPDRDSQPRFGVQRVRATDELGFCVSNSTERAADGVRIMDPDAAPLND